MTQKTQHTPTPWDLMPNGHQITKSQYEKGFLRELLIAETNNNYFDFEEEKANAAFIVRACNSYESDQKKIAALVEALEWCLPMVERHMDFVRPNELATGDYREKYRQKEISFSKTKSTLALAKGE